MRIHRTRVARPGRERALKAVQQRQGPSLEQVLGIVGVNAGRGAEGSDMDGLMHHYAEEGSAQR